jgi:D-alanyl-D-alanine carboxypeptidase
MKHSLLTAITCIGLSSGAWSQYLDKAKLDSYFNTLEQNNRFMGSVAVAKDGVIIYRKSVGMADIEAKIPATELTKYRIGSISKTFTAVLLLRAVEEQKITLSQTINKWFPDIPNANKITIQQLLTHRSGLHNFTDEDDYITWNTQPKTEQEMLAIISKGGSDFDPDSKAAYSNSNYVVLTYVLEKVYGKPYATILNEKIVQPLGLTNTYVFDKINTSNQESKSYFFSGEWKPVSETDYTIPLGAGAIASTPSDITKFAHGLFNGKLLSNQSLELMKTVKDNYAMGLFAVPFYEYTGYGHTGGIDGFSSVYSYFDEGKISYALCGNGANYNINNVSIAVLSAVYGIPYEIPVFTSITVTSEDLDQYLGVYSSTQIPLKITITKDGATLMAQATGQSSFPLDAIAKDEFSFEQAGVTLLFNVAEGSMILKQGGVAYSFTRD